MTNKICFGLWAFAYILCGALGFIPQGEDGPNLLLTALSLLFFLPPAVLLCRAGRTGDRLVLTLIRNLSVLSLGLTVALILANYLSLMAPEALGNVLYALLVLVSSPMICSGYWVLSLFCWACLLLSARSLLKRK